MIANVDQMRLLIVDDRVRVIARRNFLQQFVGFQVEYAHYIVAARRGEAEVAVRDDGNSVDPRESIDRGYGPVREGIHDADEAFACVPRIEARAADGHVVDKRPSHPKWGGNGDDTRCLHCFGGGARGEIDVERDDCQENQCDNPAERFQKKPGQFIH